MRGKHWPPLLVAALIVVPALVAAGCGGGGNKNAGGGTTTTGGGKKITVALVSDVGHFNDKSFNQSQLEGLNKAKADLGVTTFPLQSNSASDYLPNLTSAIRRHADIVISAGFLLAPATATVAKRYPNTNFAITDYPVEAPPFADKQGNVLFKNVGGLTYAANESGCLVGVLAAKMAQKEGKKVIGAVGGIKIPPVDIWIAGYQFCAKKAVPGTKILVNYSQDFVAADKCKTQAQNLISRGAKVLFQVAGLCGLGTLKAADDAGIWGIGVDKDQYNDAKRVLTSGVKRVDVGVFDTIKAVQEGKFKGGSDLNFNLKNNGMSVGKINPAVPKAFIDEMNKYKQQIIAGTLKVPTAL
jgi:basic membrane protein A and related proteins